MSAKTMMVGGRNPCVAINKVIGHVLNASRCPAQTMSESVVNSEENVSEVMSKVCRSILRKRTRREGKGRKGRRNGDSG